MPGGAAPHAIDVAIGSDGRIAATGANLAPSTAGKVIDLHGRLVTPGLVDAHQHLDKSGTRHLVKDPEASLEGASAAYRALAANSTREDIAARAERTLEACLARGTVAIRNHTNVDSDSGLRGLEGMIGLRERCRDRVTLQVVAHLTSDAPRKLGECRKWLEAAIAAGADVIGGVPQYADDPAAFLDLLFAYAEKSGLPLDMHVDEHLDSRKALLDAVIERTRAHGMQGRVAASHCCALSAFAPADARRTIEHLAESNIAVIALPTANLFIQGRGSELSPPRGLTRINDLHKAGVRVAAGSDNIQDPFIPIGSGDLLEVARWTMLAGHFGIHDLGRAFEMVSAVPAGILGLGKSWGLQPGARADLMITDAQDIDELVAAGPLARAVMVGGKLVAGTL